jgi:hypothetical protein
MASLGRVTRAPPKLGIFMTNKHGDFDWRSQKLSTQNMRTIPPNQQFDSEHSQFLVETHLPTPTTGRVKLLVLGLILGEIERQHWGNDRHCSVGMSVGKRKETGHNFVCLIYRIPSGNLT